MEKNKIIIPFLLILFFCAQNLRAQVMMLDSLRTKEAKPDSTHVKKKGKYDPGEAVIIAPNYTAQFPFASQAQRYGFNSLFGLQILYKTNKNWLMGVNGGFIYGTHVKQNYLLDSIEAGGYLVTQFNDITTVREEQWGMNIQFTAGKIIPLMVKYPDAGIMIVTGAGFIQNKIAYNVKASELPQLSPEYLKGYDRMDNGFVLSQFVGYAFMARRKYFSAYAGLQFDAGITRDRRPYDFYSMSVMNDRRYDLFVGIKAGYILPIFLKTSEKEFFYY